MNPPIIGRSAPMCRLRDIIRRLGPSTASVLITGESGTGKELVARNIHRCGGGHRPFVAINCAALNPGVLESELFGHGRGSFTGAVNAHAGLFEQAHGGTLFLDEIGEIPPYVQAKLLRVLQESEVRRMGASEVRRVDVRVISATNVDLDEKIRQREFRSDLFYRLNVIEIPVASLRERIDDLPEIIEHFFSTGRMPVPRLAGQTRELFYSYAWPGNVRELLNELERIVALHGVPHEILASMLSPRLVGGRSCQSLDMRLLYDGPLPRAVGYLEENLLRKTLLSTDWNKSQSARILGLSRQGLLKKMKRYGIDRSASEDSEIIA